MRDEAPALEPDFMVAGIRKIVNGIRTNFNSRMDYESHDKLKVIKVGPMPPWRMKLAEIMRASVWYGQVSKYSNHSNLLVIRESTIPLWEDTDKGSRTMLKYNPHHHAPTASGFQFWLDAYGVSDPASWHAGGQRHINLVAGYSDTWTYRGGLPLFPSTDLQADPENMREWYARWSELEVGEEFKLPDFHGRYDVTGRGWLRMAESWNNITGHHYEVKSEGGAYGYGGVVARLPDDVEDESGERKMLRASTKWW